MTHPHAVEIPIPELGLGLARSTAILDWVRSRDVKHGHNSSPDRARYWFTTTEAAEEFAREFGGEVVAR